MQMFSIRKHEFRGVIGRRDPNIKNAKELDRPYEVFENYDMENCVRIPRSENR
jgi:hypothetical protein